MKTLKNRIPFLLVARTFHKPSEDGSLLAGMLLIILTPWLVIQQE